ncbi:hypothetical protein BDZ94DRAFT_861028 [Collybia nuda]|uniref:T6SS Phospholipase effector Tle1-like catalytic domain-containing protein n=1 Tax=Collybia nuda TaxID=64659 RepID=A0A9P6CCT0_9AGAR|nr:hypothetical protein BDZ94DRAFT_861028 [Collybia nuda]
MSSRVTGHVQEVSLSPTLSDAATITGSPQSSKFIANGSSTLSTEFPRMIPEANTARTLVLCFDGTGDQFDSDNSNIVEFFTMLKKGDNTKQMVYYQAGIGTYIKPQTATRIGTMISKSLDTAIAWNLSSHVMDGYEFLMQNYRAGDRICIFGFSRGAYTARGLAGMLHKVGLLPACNFQQIPFAYKMYTRVDELGWKQSNAFKKAFSIDVSIEFIGVWDTVASVGLIPRYLPFSTSNTIVRTFRHAVSLDERRAKFKANLWNRPTVKEQTLGINGRMPGEPVSDGPPKAKKGDENSLRAMERKYSRKTDRETDVEEVWFAGCHCDVGGGSVDNGTEHNLARIPLRWMIRECFKAETGILFITEDLRTSGINPASLYPIVQTERPPPISTIGAHIQTIPSPKQKSVLGDVGNNDSVLITKAKTEEEHELLDILSPIYDQLSLEWYWWILEFIPIKQRYQRSDDTWKTTLRWNLGRGRVIPQQSKKIIKIHRSVKMRMDAQLAKGRKYVPKASFQTALDLGEVEWVD